MPQAPQTPQTAGVPELPLPDPTATGIPAPLGVNTYTQFNTTQMLNLLGALLLEMRTTNLILMEGFSLTGSGPPDYQYGMQVNQQGVFNG